MNDGTAPRSKKNPSSPLIVNLLVNNTPINAMVDTGSASSIIHNKILNKLIPRPYIKYQRNKHRTANNGELSTNGIVQLNIQLNHLSTFIIAEVSNHLCIDLVLGNDWIFGNEIDIITTKRCIWKTHGSQMIDIPFVIHDEPNYAAYPMHCIEILPEQQMIIPIRVRMRNIDTAIFTPSRQFIEQTKLLIPHALLKVQDGISWITIINVDESPQSLTEQMIIGTISLPTSYLLSLPLISNQTVEKIHSNDLTCRFCGEIYLSKKNLFKHLRTTGHYSTKRADGSMEQINLDVHQEINRMINHIGNSNQRKQPHSILIKYGSIFDTSKATKIKTTVKHTIEVKNSRPVVQRPYRKTKEQEKIIAEMCEQFHQDDIIRPSQSPWSSPVVLQRKKDGTWRFCIDYRKLNEVKVRVIQKSSKFFFLDIFTWFDRARRALQNCIYQKNFGVFF